MDPALVAMLTETVLLAAYVSQDVYGKPTYATAVATPCRVEYTIRRIVNAQGEERTSRARVFFDGDVMIGLRDMLTLPDGTTPPIQLLALPRDEYGVLDHVEVFL